MTKKLSKNKYTHKEANKLYKIRYKLQTPRETGSDKNPGQGKENVTK